jgi:hypothetical protein
LNSGGGGIKLTKTVKYSFFVLCYCSLIFNFFFFFSVKSTPKRLFLFLQKYSKRTFNFYLYRYNHFDRKKLSEVNKRHKVSTFLCEKFFWTSETQKKVKKILQNECTVLTTKNAPKRMFWLHETKKYLKTTWDFSKKQQQYLPSTIKRLRIQQISWESIQHVYESII